MKLLLPLTAALAAASGSHQPSIQDPDPAQRAVIAALAESGVHLDFGAKALSFDVNVLVKNDLLEYLLVSPGGAAHESLFATEATPSLINAGLLALGVEPGTNAGWEQVDPLPTLEERRAGKRPWRIIPPTGDGFYLYAAWREDDEIFFFRVEDLIANLATGRTMKRHKWVYLGSSFIQDPARGEVFAADVEGNLINISYFREGHTLLTPNLPDCEDQSIWLGNSWLVPPRNATVRLVFSREPLAAVPEGWREALPVVVTPEDPEIDND